MKYRTTVLCNQWHTTEPILSIEMFASITVFSGLQYMKIGDWTEFSEWPQFIELKIRNLSLIWVIDKLNWKTKNHIWCLPSKYCYKLCEVRIHMRLCLLWDLKNKSISIFNKIIINNHGVGWVHWEWGWLV